MNVFYKVKITKEPLGSAIRHKEPPLKGEIIVKVTDAVTRGDYKIIVLECNDEQHRVNSGQAGVDVLTEQQAIQLAADYQPGGTRVMFNPRTREKESKQIPACDLTVYLKKE